MAVSRQTWTGSGWGLFLIILYVAAAVLPVVLAAAHGTVEQNVAYDLGRHFALTGFMILGLQVFLAARIRGFERPFGLDIVLRFHKNMGILALALFLAHPLLLSAALGSASLLIGTKVTWPIWLGRLTLVLLLVNILLSAFQTRLGVRFEAWRLAHDMISPLILVLGFVHGFLVGADLLLPELRAIWTLTLLAVVLLFTYHRFIRPKILKARAYRVVEVRPEAEGVWTVVLAPPAGREVYAYLPGQFQFITFYRGRGLPVEEHHWTITSSPAQKSFVSSTIKALGDFTSTMGETKAGDMAAVQGGFGRFSFLLHPGDKDLVFIAGGIGITPLMGMLRYMRDVGDSRDVLLLYGNKTEDGIVFHEELARIAAGGHPRLRVVHVLSDPSPGWTGEKGFVDKDRIRMYSTGELRNKAFYLCGPGGLLDALTSALMDMGVREENIRTEIFSFID